MRPSTNKGVQLLSPPLVLICAAGAWLLVSAVTGAAWTPPLHQCYRSSMTGRIASNVESTIVRVASPTTLLATAVDESISKDGSAAAAATGDADSQSKESSSRLLKLDLALRSFPTDTSASSGEAAQDLLAELKMLREATPPTSSGTSSNVVTPVETYLMELLRDGPDRASLPVWARIRLLTRTSRRARLASLRRTLDLITPPPASSEDKSNSDGGGTSTNDVAVVREDDSEQRRRRRALIQVLRTLASPGTEFNTSSRIPAIRQIELKAQREMAAAAAASKSSRSLSLDALKQRRPVDLETPSYTVLQTVGGTFTSNVEIRLYDDFTVCSVNMNQLTRAADSRTDAAVNEPAKGGVKAFGALAGYLFGKNVEQKAMKMTSPVLTTEDQVMSFVLPSVYWDKPSTASGSAMGSSSRSAAATAATVSPPRPLPGSGVTIERIPGETRAVLLFGGYAVNVDQRKQELLRQVNALKSITNGEPGAPPQSTNWEVVPGAKPVLAQYNDPFTPPWKRLNEVSVAVRQRL